MQPSFTVKSFLHGNVGTIALQLAGLWLASFGLACTHTATAIANGTAAAEAMRGTGGTLAARKYDGSERARQRWFGMVRDGTHQDTTLLRAGYVRSHMLLLLLVAWLLGGAVATALFGESPTTAVVPAAAEQGATPMGVIALLLALALAYAALLGPAMAVSASAEGLGGALLTVGLRATGKEGDGGPGLWAGELLMLTDRLGLGYRLLGPGVIQWDDDAALGGWGGDYSGRGRDCGGGLCRQLSLRPASQGRGRRKGSLPSLVVNTNRPRSKVLTPQLTMDSQYQSSQLFI